MSVGVAINCPAQLAVNTLFMHRFHIPTPHCKGVLALPGTFQAFHSEHSPCKQENVSLPAIDFLPHVLFADDVSSTIQGKERQLRAVCSLQ